MPEFQPPLVITLHGIRTKGEWQEEVAGNLKAAGIPVENYKFGYYPLRRFLSHRQNRRMVERFRDFYDRAVGATSAVDLGRSDARPSVIAHSFGTYIVGYSLLMYPHIKFDKVIFCGAILPTNFDWSIPMARDQVGLIRNDYGVQDRWTRLVGWFIKDTGPSGYTGFDLDCALLEEVRFDYFGHSHFFYDTHFRTQWLPVLRKPPSSLHVRHGRALKSVKEFDALRVCSRVIDTDAFGHDPAYVGLPYEVPSRWIEINPDIYTFLVDRDDGTCRGYINAMPLTDECFARVKAGQVRDPDISDKDVEPFTPGRRLKLYIMSIGVERALRHPGGGLMPIPVVKLVNGLCDKLAYHAQMHQCYVTELLSVAWTTPGRKLCETLGMAVVGKDPDGHDIYWVDLAELGASLQAKGKKTRRRIFPGLDRVLRACGVLK